ncbi:MAG: hypothetical protein H6711_01455 [Myxococcales bacterium]|nr:hypothetical protein [Myxococcales bacterium]
MRTRPALLALAALLSAACRPAEERVITPEPAPASEAPASEARPIPRTRAPTPEDAGDADAASEADAVIAQRGDTQEITFDGEEADPEMATEIRSAPKRPTIPAFRLFGTRAGDGP